MHPRRRPAAARRRSHDGRLLFAPEAARPWPSLVFLSPFLVFYTAGLVWVRPDLAAGVDLLLRRALALVGLAGVLAPAGLVVGALLAWHLARKDPWRFRLALLPAMVLETMMLTVPLVALQRVFQSAAPPSALELAEDAPSGLLAAAMTSIGAGIYEELIFRLALIGGLVFLMQHVFRLERRGAVVAGVLVAAGLFAGAHTLGDPQLFTWPTFLFRTAAGVYLAVLFATRGFGIASGVHVVFNLVVKLIPGG
ncbi:MAG TPA: CPBP family glutamic-type intramembrane protease [Phycisphaerae bacterium]|nr:CPBP family glutamic-type intramembrane protease [Phycisphaerae bacterium]HUX16255.1 CPBP family glutamic-type intramembrane protease [Phycisphaerae bacterium]